jgi:twitching motility protein PilT
MPKIDAYLRSIERFGATGALLISGQSVTLRFPTGDRHATQVTPHELLVAMIREVAPASAWAAVETQRHTRFELDSGGHRFAIAVSVQPGSWNVAIDVAAAGAVPSSDSGAGGPGRAADISAKGRGGAATLDSGRVAEMSASLSIERTPYDDAGAATASGSGSLLLDQLLGWAQARDASDLVLASGAPAVARIDGMWTTAGPSQVIDGDVLARELGVMAPAVARASWSERGEGVFAVGEASGRLRVSLGRDANGPRAAIRFVRRELLGMAQLGIPDAVRGWLKSRRGLIIVSGAPGSGKTTTLAALVRDLSSRQSHAIVSIEDPIEVLHQGSSLVSQREVGAHVASLAAGVRGAMREGADVIAVSQCNDAETSQAIGSAVDAGHLVLVAVDGTTAAGAVARVAEQPGATAASRTLEVIAAGTLGVLVQELWPAAQGHGRRAAFEVVPGGPDLMRVVRERRWDALPELIRLRAGDGAVSMAEAVSAWTER